MSDADYGIKSLDLGSRPDLVQIRALIVEGVPEGSQCALFNEPLAAKSATAQATFAQIASYLLGRAIKLGGCIGNRKKARNSG